MTDRKAQGATITYDALNRRTGATYAGGATTGWTYDLGGHLTQIVDSVGGTISRTYDGQNRVLGETTPQGTISYTYDTAGQLTNAGVANISVAGQVKGWAYTYGNHGNRLTQQVTVKGATDVVKVTAYQWDNANQLSSSTPILLIKPSQLRTRSRASSDT